METPIYITKASGKSVPFSAEKLKKSLKNSGADDVLVNAILEEVTAKLYEGMSTGKIYKMAFRLLKAKGNYIAAKYNLKQGIMELGPSGYPFELFIGELFKHQGYSVLIGQTIQGKCVTHEIDVIARKTTDALMIECKYHNQSGTISDVKIPLYIQSRFKDVEQTWLSIKGNENINLMGGVITNTKFTSDAIKYGTCAGLHLLGWDYPSKKGLKDQIDALGLYPLTCLTTLTNQEKQYLLDSKIVLCKTILENPVVLDKYVVLGKRSQAVLTEVKALCIEIKQKNGYGKK
ncbi:MAG: PD-(D/E)XK nuclease superfamily protein [Bacteroidia bacterium]